MLPVHNFSYGLLTPGLAYAMSCLGAFLGLRCTTRARAYSGPTRARWLVLSAVSIGATGIWVMHFIAMLGFTIPGQTIRYNVPVTILSMLIAVAVVCGGLFIVGFGRDTFGRLMLAGVVTGIGVASMHYSGMAAMRSPARMTYSPVLLALSLIIAIVASTVALWFTLRLRGIWATLGAALIMGVAVSGMHYTGMAAMHVFAAPPAGGMLMGGASATAFLLPLILGISILTFIVTATIALSPTDTEIRAERELMSRIAARAAADQAQAPYIPAIAARQPVTAISRAVQARRQAESEKRLTVLVIRAGTLAAEDRAAGPPSAPQCRRAARHRLSGRSPAISTGSSHQAGTVVLLSA